MGLFTKTTHVELQLNEQAKSELEALASDMKTLATMALELNLRATAVMEKLGIEDTIDLAALRLPEIGVQVFASERPADARGRDHEFATPTPTEFAPTVSPEERVRSSPWTRRPRSEQRVWVLDLLADSEWHTANEFAVEFGGDDLKARRYLKSAVGGVMLELYREGILERGESLERHSVHKYRLARR